jgi:hypothetical protein
MYLANSDKDITRAPDGMNVRTAENTLRDLTSLENMECFTGFATSSFNSHQGMLCQVAR